MTGTICVRDGDVLSLSRHDRRGAYERARPISAGSPGGSGSLDHRGRVLLSGKVERIPDCLADPEYVVPMGALASNVRSLLGVPLLRKDGIEGAIIL